MTHLYLVAFILAIAAMATGRGWLAAGLFAAGLILGLAVDSRPAPRISQLRRRQLDDIVDKDLHP